MSASRPAPRWFKSSYSQGGEGNCVETAGLVEVHCSNDGSYWFKSSYSQGGEGACVETAAMTFSVGVRDSKDLAVGQLAVEPVAWAALVASLKSR